MNKTIPEKMENITICRKDGTKLKFTSEEFDRWHPKNGDYFFEGDSVYINGKKIATLTKESADKVNSDIGMGNTLRKYPEIAQGIISYLIKTAF